MAAQGHALVIGGGVIGVSAAYYLGSDGWSVTLVEKDDIAAGSSYGNSGLVVPSHSVPLAAPGVLLKGVKWMLNPESPFYIKPRLDRDLLAWLWRFGAASRLPRVRRAIPVLRDLSQASLGLYRELAAPGLPVRVHGSRRADGLPDGARLRGGRARIAPPRRGRPHD